MRCRRVDALAAMNLRSLIFTGSEIRCLLTFWIACFQLQAIASDSVTRHEVACASIDACLQRVISAPERINFEGTFVVGGGNQAASSHIVHYGDGHRQLERVERLDGPERVLYRRDDEVLTVRPAERSLSIESRRMGKRFPVISREGSERIADHYSFAAQGTSRVAGRLADVISLSPKDAYRYGYRLWLDIATGLPLRAEIIGAQQQVLEWAAFSDVTIGIKADPQRVLQGMRPHEGWAVKQSAVADVDLAYEGWALHDVPPGFQLLQAVKRMVAPADVSAPDQVRREGLPMLQLIFSDGLTYVSVFVEPSEAHIERQNMLVSMGATQAMMVRRDAWCLTAVGDVPALSLKVFVTSLQRKN